MSDLSTLLHDCRSAGASADAMAEKIASEQASRPRKAPAAAAASSLTSLIPDDEADEPWKIAGVSRATFFRQQAKAREGDPFIPQLMMLWCALQRGDQLTAERLCARMLQSPERPTADARTVDAILRTAIQHARKARAT